MALSIKGFHFVKMRNHYDRRFIRFSSARADSVYHMHLKLQLLKFKAVIFRNRDVYIPIFSSSLMNAFLSCYFCILLLVIIISLFHKWWRKHYLLGQVYQIVILMDLNVLRSPEPKTSHFQRMAPLSFFFSACMCMCFHNKSKTIQSRNTKFDITYFNHMLILLESFYEHWTKIFYTRAHKSIQIHCNLRNGYFVCEFKYVQTALNIMKLIYIFDIHKNM